MSSQTMLAYDQDPLVERSHPDNENINFSITLIEAVGELLSINPMEKQFHLIDHIDLDLLDHAYRFHDALNGSAVLSFEYGGYLIECCMDGAISIYGDELAHESGDVDLPASMR